MAIWQQCELMAAGHGSSDLSSCEKGEQWQLALTLLNEMWEANSLEPDVIRVIRQGLGRARRRPGPVRDAEGEAGAQRHQPRHWPRKAQAWPRARCGRRSWSPTSSAKALAARRAGLVAAGTSVLSFFKQLCCYLADRGPRELDLSSSQPRFSRRVFPAANLAADEGGGGREEG